RPLEVRTGSQIASPFTLSTGAPQGCVLSPLFTCDCSAKHSSKTVFRFADDTTIMRHHHQRKSQRGDHNFIHINGAVERVKTMEHDPLLSLYTVPWRSHLGGSLLEPLHKHISERKPLCFLWRLKRFAIFSDIMSNFSCCTTESIPTSCITVWYTSCSSLDRKSPQREVSTAELITGNKPPALQEIYQTHCLRKACSITLLSTCLRHCHQADTSAASNPGQPD
ncbi:hypothetical protein QTP70_015023, partial [Hemibagrus guttatus]